MSLLTNSEAETRRVQGSTPASPIKSRDANKADNTGKSMARTQGVSAGLPSPVSQKSNNKMFAKRKKGFPHPRIQLVALPVTAAASQSISKQESIVSPSGKKHPQQGTSTKLELLQSKEKQLRGAAVSSRLNDVRPNKNVSNSTNINKDNNNTETENKDPKEIVLGEFEFQNMLVLFHVLKTFGSRARMGNMYLRHCIECPNESGLSVCEYVSESIITAARNHIFAPNDVNFLYSSNINYDINKNQEILLVRNNTKDGKKKKDSNNDFKLNNSNNINSLFKMTPPVGFEKIKNLLNNNNNNKSNNNNNMSNKFVKGNRNKIVSQSTVSKKDNNNNYNNSSFHTIEHIIMMEEDVTENPQKIFGSIFQNTSITRVLFILDMNIPVRHSIWFGTIKRACREILKNNIHIKFVNFIRCNGSSVYSLWSGLRDIRNHSSNYVSATGWCNRLQVSSAGKNTDKNIDNAIKFAPFVGCGSQCIILFVLDGKFNTPNIEKLFLNCSKSIGILTNPISFDGSGTTTRADSIADVNGSVPIHLLEVNAPSRDHHALAMSVDDEAASASYHEEIIRKEKYKNKLRQASVMTGGEVLELSYSDRPVSAEPTQVESVTVSSKPSWEILIDVVFDKNVSSIS